MWTLASHLVRCRARRVPTLRMCMPHLAGVRAQSTETNTAPSTVYERRVEAGEIRADDYQRQIVAMLDELHHALRTYEQPEVPDPNETAPASSGGISSLLGPISGLFGSSETSGKDEGKQVRPEGTPQCLYLYGTVGTGKSMVMDLFYKTLPACVTRKSRVHFHQFMIDVHKSQHKFKSQYGSAEGKKLSGPDALERVIRQIARDSQVLCFDEFQVVDIVDAMILRRLLEGLLRYGVVIVITSNRHPTELYKNGIQRASFIPCIELIEAEYRVVSLSSGTDYRKVPQIQYQTYFLAPDSESAAQYEQIWQSTVQEEGEQVVEDRPVSVWGRDLLVPRSTSRVARFSFKQLCGEARSPADYIALCQKFDVFFIDDIPRMDLDMRDLARRFINFVDAAYESKVRVFCTSEVEITDVFSDPAIGKQSEQQSRVLMDDLKMDMKTAGDSSIFSGQEEVFAFARLVSRLSEMRTKPYAELSIALHRN